MSKTLIALIAISLFFLLEFLLAHLFDRIRAPSRQRIRSNPIAYEKTLVRYSILATLLATIVIGFVSTDCSLTPVLDHIQYAILGAGLCFMIFRYLVGIYVQKYHDSFSRLSKFLIQNLLAFLSLEISVFLIILLVCTPFLT